MKWHKSSATIISIITDYLLSAWGTLATRQPLCVAEQLSSVTQDGAPSCWMSSPIRWRPTLSLISTGAARPEALLCCCCADQTEWPASFSHVVLTNKLKSSCKFTRLTTQTAAINTLGQQPFGDDDCRILPCFVSSQTPNERVQSGVEARAAASQSLKTMSRSGACQRTSECGYNLEFAWIITKSCRVRNSLLAKTACLHCVGMC